MHKIAKVFVENATLLNKYAQLIGREKSILVGATTSCDVTIRYSGIATYASILHCLGTENGSDMTDRFCIQSQVVI